jgi:hypothetical protein
MTPWIARALLTGLRYRREQIDDLIKGIATMVLGIRGIEESWVYQDIFNKGRGRGSEEDPAEPGPEEAGPAG